MTHSLVIFGASGDLTSRKLIPALYRLHCRKRLPAGSHVVGMSRTPMSHDAWRDSLAETTAAHLGKEFDRARWQEFASGVYYQPGDVGDSAAFTALNALLAEIEKPPVVRLYYLAASPQLYLRAVERIGAAGMADESSGPRRIVVEKPFGHDLESARQLNRAMHEVFREQQIYRIDHYLGKETVQNVLVLRFANSIFEPVWNRNYIDHVQITVAEEVGVGRRGGYYDKAGVLRDMFQNHLLQLLMITAMEAPVRFEADLVRDEKVKVLRAMRPLSGADVRRDTLRGRYQGYLQEEGVPADSQTATFAAVKLQVDNWRFNGVPFYLRSGKAMSCRTTQIVIQFREPPHLLFTGGKGGFEANRLVLQVQPAEGIQLQFQTKVPDEGMRLCTTDLDFRFDREFEGALPDAYQRLLLDALNGDASLFARSDEVELAWGIFDPVLAAWESGEEPPLLEYEKGMWGPDDSAEWMYQQGRQWFDVCPVLH